ncbi:MAG: type IV toxin-antitoxin system AbiEi family antitoxin domain-containing protein [Bacteroidota bacterium]|nr:type IV toxin-antitoxin system AbiEi family antitoxin domain-containing protein [Bacteroidota bacterium]
MEKIIKYFRSNMGYARMKDLKKASFQTRDISALLKEGIIERVKPGLYRLVDIKGKDVTNLSMLDVCQAVPKGVICLVTALSYYNLSTFNPSEIYIAIPHATKPLKVNYPPIKYFYFRERFFKYGIDKIETKMGEIKIYNKEKTVCDMFRYRNKLGTDIALEGLKSYLKLKEANINKLNKYAEICQVKTVMMPYVRAIVG